jgi:glycosyltransferase involved in cell wall biosynthesis
VAAIPDISVVMSVFNGECFLREAVESILTQSFRDFEFIVIDDGSADAVRSMLHCYQTRDSRIRVYHQENRGLVASLNRGCGLARGKYIARMDADDIAIRDRLAWQIEFMERHPEVAVVGGAVQFIDQSGKALRTAGRPLHNPEIQEIILGQSGVMWHPTVLMRKAAFSQVGGYRNVADAEDYDLWLRMAERFELANLPEVLLKYRIHPGQVSVAKCRKQALGAAVAKAAAAARRSGKPDPLQSIAEITPTALARLGVSEALQHTTLARGYLSSIRNMCDAGAFARALEMFENLRASDLTHAERWTIADLHLCGARLYWRQRKLARCALNVMNAIVSRPIILGRPFKTLLTRFSAILHVKNVGIPSGDMSVLTRSSR